MDGAVAQVSGQSLPELVRIVIETFRSLQLTAPSTFQHGHYVEVWAALLGACDKLVGTVEDHRLNPGHERWETGDEASIELFGELSVRQAKEFLQRVLHELAYLGDQDFTQSTSMIIDTQLFDPDWVPLPPADQAAAEDAMSVVPLPEGHIAASTEPITSFMISTAARPTYYQTPPRGPSCSPITPSSQRHTVLDNNDSNIDCRHPPCQHPGEEKFSHHDYSVDCGDDEIAERMFEEPTPTIEQEVAPPHLSLQPRPAMDAEHGDTEVQAYMASVQRIEENIDALVFLLQIRPRWSADVDSDASSLQSHH